MKETFIVKALLDIKQSSTVQMGIVFNEKEFKEFPTEEQILAFKNEVHADRCEVVKVFR